MPEDLFRDRLIAIETKVDRILEKQENMISVDGPIGRMRADMAIIAQKTDAAHIRLDDHDNHLSKLSERQWKLWAQAAGVGAGGAGVLWVVFEVVKKAILHL